MLELHRQCRLLALQHIAQRVANHQDFDARALFERGETCIIAGNDRDLFALRFHAREIRQLQRLAVGEIGHVIPPVALTIPQYCR